MTGRAAGWARLGLVLFALGGARSAAAEGEGVFAPRPLARESYGESFTAFADLDDGTYVLLQYLFTNAGLGDGNAVCRALVVPPGRAGKNRLSKVSRSGWRFDADTRSLRVGDCRLSNTGEKTEFSAKTEDLSVRLELEGGPHPLRPPGARLSFEGKIHESEILIPWARASAEIQDGGGAPRRISGQAHLDHTRGDAALKELATGWLRFRGLSGKERLLFQVRFPPRGAPPEAWIWREADPKPTRVLSSGSLPPAPKRGPFRVSFPLPSGEVLELETLSPIFEYRPVEQYGLLGSLAKPWVGNPVNTTYRARARWLSAGSVLGEVRGTLEHQDLSP